LQSKRGQQLQNYTIITQKDLLLSYRSYNVTIIIITMIA
jgi:hypothetical protein